MKFYIKNLTRKVAVLMVSAVLLTSVACVQGNNNDGDVSGTSLGDTDVSGTTDDTNDDSNNGESELSEEMEQNKEEYLVPLHGWDVYRNLDKLSLLDINSKTLQFSSFDRTGGNTKDGFDGTYSYLRREGSEYVIAEHIGAGEVQSIWFTRDGGNVSKTGKIMIELDGELVVDTSLQGLVNGDLGAPFVFPFVANADQTSGGVTIKVPMPYKKSMRILTSSNPQFYHVSYRAFSSSEGIETFDPNDVPEDLMAKADTWGHEDPKPEADTIENTGSFSLDAGESIVIDSYEGSGQVQNIEFDISDLVGAPAAEVVIDDGRAHVGSSQFDMAIDSNNEGVILTRRYDSISTNQTANIYVDDELAGQWTGQGIVPGGWVEETVLLPAEFTSGKELIHIRNEFVSAGMDFSEFRFFVDSIVDGEEIRTDELDVGPFVAGQQSEEAHNYSVSSQNWEGDRTYILPSPIEDETDILRTDSLLEGLRLQVTVDGEMKVDSPFAIFFGSGLGHYEVHTLMHRITPEGKYQSWWPMPFGENIEIKLVNESDVPLEESNFKVEIKEDEEIKTLLEGDIPTIGYFNAIYEDRNTSMGRDWTFMNINGFGKFVGITHKMDSLQAEGNTRGYLEGDERFYMDGIRSPIWHGTGTEDFYEGGWYFNQGVFSNPMNGAPATEAAGMYGTTVQSDSNYRLLIGDQIAFLSSFDAGFEPGPQQDHSAHYSATAYWYGHKDKAVLFETDTILIGDEESEEAHSYSGGGDVNKMLTTFEGKNDKIGVNGSRRDSDEDISFTIQLDEANQGVRLVRMADQNRSYQEAEVYFNGVHVGTWLQVLGNQNHRWLEDSFEIPSYITKGQSEATIELRLAEGSQPWSASKYSVYSILPMQDVES